MLSLDPFQRLHCPPGSSRMEHRWDQGPPGGGELWLSPGLAAKTSGVRKNQRRGMRRKGTLWSKCARIQSLPTPLSASRLTTRGAANWWLNGPDSRIFCYLSLRINSYLQSFFFYFSPPTGGFLSWGKSDHGFLPLYLLCTGKNN